MQRCTQNEKPTTKQELGVADLNPHRNYRCALRHLKVARVPKMEPGVVKGHVYTSHSLERSMSLYVII